MQRITPFLWFNDQAEEAARYYTSVFKNSKITGVAKPPNAPSPDGKALVVNFELDGQEYTAMNGGPGFPFTWAVSLYVSCDTQEEVDYYWEKLSDGGEESRCGWLKDRWGLSWQIVPTALMKYLSGKDADKSRRVMDVVMRSVKLNVKEIEEA